MHVSAPPEFAQFAIVIDALGMVTRSQKLETGMSMLSVELEALVRNVRTLLELESCFPRERLLQADEMSAGDHVADIAPPDEVSQRWSGNAETVCNLVYRQISAQQSADFRNTISELRIELRTWCAVRNEAGHHEMTTERRSRCGLFHEVTSAADTDAAACAGQGRSGRKSRARTAPEVALSIRMASSADTRPLSFACQIDCCFTPQASASFDCEPACEIAASMSSRVMGQII